MRSSRWALCAVVVWLAGFQAAIAAERMAEIEFFETRIRPLLVKHCLDCHGEDDAGGKLRLDSRAGWERGGERGPVIA
ncbi:MAG: c-type cytochrome domain-containing protein, partial [Planctomycetales bacterium]